MNWLGHLCREWTVASWRGIAPASAKPEPQHWDNSRVTAAWLGHSTVLINFFGVTILTDPVLFPRIGIRLPWLTIGPKRLTKPALEWNELPPIDLVLLSHAHFDHFDTRTLHCLSRRRSPRRPKADFDSSTAVITAPRTRDLLRWMCFRDVTELHWGEERTIVLPNESVTVKAIRVNHWGARMLRDTYRGYNGYIIECRGRRIIFGGDTAFTDAFAELRDDSPERRTISRTDRTFRSPRCKKNQSGSPCARSEKLLSCRNSGARTVRPWPVLEPLPRAFEYILSPVDQCRMEPKHIPAVQQD